MARDLREMIQILADKGDEVYSKICKVDRVDEARRVIDATPINGDAQVLAVRLQPVEKRKEGLIFVPKIGSFVMITFFGVYDAYMAMGTVFEKVLLDIGDIHLELLNPEEDGKGKVLLKVGESAMELTSDDKGYAKLKLGEVDLDIAPDENGRTKVNVDCHVTAKEKNDRTPVITFNGGEHGGLVIAESVYNQLDALQTWCKNHTHSCSGTCTDGGSCTGVTIASKDQLPPLSLKDLKNDNIWH
ncbi:MAG: hypothetical protein PUB21_10830 [Bacteroidales bacterium]|nr:hypothetical protein [Bacteroidales bacterium]